MDNNHIHTVNLIERQMRTVAKANVCWFRVDPTLDPVGGNCIHSICLDSVLRRGVHSGDKAIRGCTCSEARWLGSQLGSDER